MVAAFGNARHRLLPCENKKDRIYHHSLCILIDELHDITHGSMMRPANVLPGLLVRERQSSTVTRRRLPHNLVGHYPRCRNRRNRQFTR